MFNRLVWQRDRMLLDDLVFRLEDYRSADWNGGDHFRFYKVKGQVDQYANFFSRRSDFRPERVMELGIYDGGTPRSGMSCSGPKSTSPWTLRIGRTLPISAATSSLAGWMGRSRHTGRPTKQIKPGSEQLLKQNSMALSI